MPCFVLVLWLKNQGGTPGRTMAGQNNSAASKTQTVQTDSTKQMQLKL